MKEKKKLSEFLKENGVYENFIKYCLNDGDTIEDLSTRNASDIGILYGFVWEDTPQGKDFWDELYTKSLKFDIIYDMDEILYKEYERRNMKESSEQNPITKDIVENGEVENTKQEFQTITLNGIEYNLIPKEISVGYIANFYDKDMKAESTEEYLKRKFEEGNGEYGVLFKEKKSKEWSFCYGPCDSSWRKDWDYKLIKKEHKEIFEAYLKDRNTKIEYHINLQEWDNKWMPCAGDLIENYDEDYCYRITKKKFEPFTLNIKVNTIDEAKSLWNRFNLNNDTLCKSMGSPYYNVELQNIINDMKYWKQLDNILKDLGEEPDGR